MGDLEFSMSELAFPRPFSYDREIPLVLRNDQKRPIVFKVMVTAPTKYCVRPNRGRIEAGESLTVNMVLCAMSLEPPPDAYCRDKYLVQYIKLDGNASPVDHKIFEDAKALSEYLVHSKKIPVRWLPPRQQQPNDRFFDAPPPSYDEISGGSPQGGSTGDQIGTLMPMGSKSLRDQVDAANANIVLLTEKIEQQNLKLMELEGRFHVLENELELNRSSDKT